jgi:hypothetical protein
VYVVYVNKRVPHAFVHADSCRVYLNRDLRAKPENGRWVENFITRDEALTYARGENANARSAKCCD